MMNDIDKAVYYNLEEARLKVDQVKMKRQIRKSKISSFFEFSENVKKSKNLNNHAHLYPSQHFHSSALLPCSHTE